MKFNKIKTVMFFVALFYCFSLFSESTLAISGSEINKRLQEIEDNNKSPHSGLSNEELERVLNYLNKRYSEIDGDTKEEKYFNAVNIYKNSKISFDQIAFITLMVLFLFLLLILVSSADFFSKIRRKIKTTRGGDELFLIIFIHTMFFSVIFTMLLLVSLYNLTQFYF